MAATDGGFKIPEEMNASSRQTGKNLDSRNIGEWIPRKMGAQILLEGIEVVVDEDASGITIRQIRGAPLRLKIGPRYLHPRLAQADAAQIALGRGSRVAALNLRVPVDDMSFRSLACQPYVLSAAWKRVAQGGPGTGVDKISCREIRCPEKFIEVTSQRMKSGRIAPKPLKQIYVPKADGVRWRTLAIPTVRDRLIQTAICEVLTPLYEERFLDCSYGFRANRSGIDAIRQLRAYFDAGYRWVVSIDLKDYFETIPWDILKSFLKKDIPDHGLIIWIMRQIAAPIVPAPLPTTGDISSFTPPAKDGSHVMRDRGVPQGAPLSPLLGNVLLHRFDVWIVQNRRLMVRYADDITLVAKRKADAARLLELAMEYLEERLGLIVNREKTNVMSAGAGATITALGFDIARGRILPSAKNVEKCKRQLSHILDQPIPPIIRRYVFTKNASWWRQYFRESGDLRIRSEIEEWAEAILREFSEKVAGTPDDPSDLARFLVARAARERNRKRSA